MFKTRKLEPLPDKVSGAVFDWPASGQARAIVKVLHPGHVPEGVALRSRIDDTLFTCEFDIAALERIAGDPLVQAISAAELIQPAQPPATVPPLRRG